MKTRRVKTYYVSGPMRGIPRYNFPMFDSLSAWLRSQGLEAINPADHDREVEPDVESQEHYLHGDPSLKTGDRPDFHQLIGWDLRMLASPECDGIVLMPGWRNSVGAQHERYVAEATGKEVWLAYQDSVTGEWYSTMDDDRSLSAKREVEGDTVGVNDAWRRDLESVRGAMGAEPFPEERIEARLVSYGPLTVHDEPRQGKVEVIEYAGVGDFVTKDSGVRKAFDSGMVRDTDEGKPRYDLIPLMPLKRLAELYARGAQKYGDRNWQKANSQEELDRFKASAFRHFIQWLSGDVDEDHGIAVVWNIFAALWVEAQLSVRDNG